MLLYYQEDYLQKQADTIHIIVKMKSELIEYARKNGADFDENENFIQGSMPDGKKTHFLIRWQRLQTFLDFVASADNLIESFKDSVSEKLDKVTSENLHLKTTLLSSQKEFQEYKITQCYDQCPRLCNALRQHNQNPRREGIRALTILQFQNQYPNLL
jgi:hypothetical protein